MSSAKLPIQLCYPDYQEGKRNSKLQLTEFTVQVVNNREGLSKLIKQNLDFTA